MKTELPGDLVARILAVFEFDNCDELWWRLDDGVLCLFAQCSDFFAWGCADLEPIQTGDDVSLLERCRAELTAATGDNWPQWISELYAARRRNAQPASFMLGDGKYAMAPEVQPLFTVGADA